MELVDEQDHLAIGVLDLLEDGLEPLLELATELCARDERTEVERETRLSLSPSGTSPRTIRWARPSAMAVLPTPGSPMRTGLFLVRRDRTWMHTTDLVVAADDGIEPSGASLGGEVAAVLLERRVCALRIGRGDPLAATDAGQRLEECLAPGGMAVEQRLALATELGDGEQEVLRRDVVVAETAGLGLGQFDGAAGARIERQRAALDPCAAGQDGCQLAAERGQVDTEPAQGLGRDAVIGLEQSREDVLGIEHGAVEALGRRLGGDDGLLGLLREAVELHLWFSLDVGGGQPLRGSGWSARKRNVLAADVPPRTMRSAGRGGI